MSTNISEASPKVFTCPSCQKKLAFSKVYYVSKDSKVTCNHCKTTLTPGNAATSTLFVGVMFVTVVVGFVLSTFIQPMVWPEARFVGRVALYFPIMVVVYTLLAYLFFYRKIWFKKRDS